MHVSSLNSISPAQARRRVWRWLGWGGVMALLGVIGVGVLTMLRPPGRLSARDVVTVQVRSRTGQVGTAILVRHADRWVGSAADFPPGSVTHVHPPADTGFFLVRADPGGFFRAYADRSPHRGEPLDYRDPLPGSLSHADGPQPGFYDPDVGANHTLDGEAFSGPSPRPLDPFPLVVDGDRLEIALRAECPSDLPVRPAWCGAAGEGPRGLPAGAVVVLPLHGQIRVLSERGLRAGVDPTRPLTEQELRAWGFTVAHTVSELEQLGAIERRVVWLQHDTLGDVSAAWAQARNEEGTAFGVLDGTMADLADRIGLGENAAGWIQPGTGRPVFALVRARCRDAPGRGQTSDWLSVSWLLTATTSALRQSCP